MDTPIELTSGAAAVGVRGVISAGDRFAAETGLRVLQEGGNAFDAALAASMVQCVAEAPWGGLGGDAFVLVHTPEGAYALNGSGAAPQAIGDVASPGGRIARFGPTSVAVPGFVDAWCATVDRFATRSRKALIAPAIAYARDGLVLDGGLAAAVQRVLAGESGSLGSILTDNGQHPGALFRQPDLARTLDMIATDGTDIFYRGPIAAAIAEHLRVAGGCLDLDDLAAHRSNWVAPIRAGYRGRDILEHPPVSLGAVLLQELQIADGFDLGRFGIGDPEFVDVQTWCKQAAFADTHLLSEAAGSDYALQTFLSLERAAWWRDRYRTGIAGAGLPDALPPASNDTTSLAAADCDGNTVVIIHSLFNEFGAREVVPGTGIILNDRLANLPTDQALPVAVRGGHKPLHTLNAYIVVEDGAPIFAGATPGGRGQVQTNFQVLSYLLDMGLSPQAAVESPRWLSGTPRTAVSDSVLYLEESFPATTVSWLREAGHDVRVADGPRTEGDDLFGACPLVGRDPASGELTACSDHRRDTVAAGW